MKAVFEKNRHGLVFAVNKSFGTKETGIRWATPSLKIVEIYDNGKLHIGKCQSKPVFDENHKDSAEKILLEAWQRYQYHSGLESL